MFARDIAGGQGLTIEWETLLAGILAIGAALMTVKAMYRNEEFQQQRHMQLMRLNVRGDQIAAERAAFRIDLLYMSNDFLPDRAEYETAASSPYTSVTAYAKAAERWLSDIREEIGHQSIYDAKHLFDGSTVDAFDRFRLEAGILDDTIVYATTDFDQLTSATAQQRMARIENALNTVYDTVIDIAKSLTELGDLYTRPHQDF